MNLIAKNLPVRLIYCLLALFLLASRTKAAPDSESLKFVHDILNSELFPEVVHNTELVPQETQGRLKMTNVHTYKIVGREIASQSYNVCHFIDVPNERPDIMINLANDDITSVSTEPKWDVMQQKWDNFVFKYWPGAQRLTRWQDEIWRYRPAKGLFSMQYTILVDGVQSFNILLDIRLGDGLIGGVITDNAKAHPAKLTQTPPLTSIELANSISEATKNSPAISSQNPDIVKKDRVWGWTGPGTRGIYEVLSLNAKQSDGTKLLVGVKINEATKKAVVTYIHSASEVQEQRQRPYTTIADSEPRWSRDGSIVFDTTRTVKDRPWWQRDTPVSSSAVVRFQKGAENSVALVRPIKGYGDEWDNYRHPIISPKGEYLAMVREVVGGDKLLVTGLDTGISYLPSRDPSWSAELKTRWHLPSALIPKGPVWETLGGDWLEDSSGMVLSMQVDFSDHDIYLIERDGSKPPQEWSLIPIANSRGEDILPRLSSANDRIAWAHKTPDVDDVQDEQGGWQFNVASFDVASKKLSAIKNIPLPDSPQSISYNKKGNAWLVVLGSGKMMWIREKGMDLVASVCGALKWGDKEVIPNFADSSPSGDRIVIAASLEKPLMSAVNQTVVESALFLWDGSGGEVKPAFDVSLNDLPLYVFPKTNLTWGKVLGNIKEFGISDVDMPKE